MPTMIRIKGREVSEDTIALALMQYFTEHSEEYIFQAGDVAENMNGDRRLIINIDEKLRAVNIENGVALFTNGQVEFEKCKYRKIGVLSEYIK